MTVYQKDFAYHLHSTAEWRDAKAEQWPDDHRNSEAAALLETLAEQVADLDHDEFEPLAQALGDYDFPEAELVNNYISRIGFDHFPANAKYLVRDLAAELATA